MRLNDPTPFEREVLQALQHWANNRVHPHLLQFYGQKHFYPGWGGPPIRNPHCSWNTYPDLDTTLESLRVQGWADYTWWTSYGEPKQRIWQITDTGMRLGNNPS